MEDGRGPQKTDRTSVPADTVDRQVEVTWRRDMGRYFMDTVVNMQG